MTNPFGLDGAVTKVFDKVFDKVVVPFLVTTLCLAATILVAGVLVGLGIL